MKKNRLEETFKFIDVLIKSENRRIIYGLISIFISAVFITLFSFIFYAVNKQYNIINLNSIFIFFSGMLLFTLLIDIIYATVVYFVLFLFSKKTKTFKRIFFGISLTWIPLIVFKFIPILILTTQKEIIFILNLIGYLIILVYFIIFIHRLYKLFFWKICIIILLVCTPVIALDFILQNTILK